MKNDMGGIKRLKKKLYSRSGVPKKTERYKLHGEQYDIPRQWGKSKEIKRSRKVRKGNIPRLLLISSAIFFLIAVIISLITFFGNSNTVSADNIDIEVSGPIAHPGGEELSLQISIVNRNTVPMLFADMIIEYPEGTRSANDLNVELPRVRESLGTIQPGDRTKTTVRSVLFGEENVPKEIKITIEYRVEGSNAIFFKEQVHEVIISSSPLSVLVDSLDEVVSGQTISFAVTVVSNSVNVIEDVLLEAVYPFGFAFEDSSPNPQFDENIWNLGDLVSGQERTVTIRGTLTGQDLEERTFRFNTGVRSEQNEREVSAAFSSAATTLTIKRPFVSVTADINGDTSSEYVSGTNKEIIVRIDWSNNLPDEVTDVAITATLRGNALDKRSVSVQRGFYQSANNTIVWNRSTESKLERLAPGSKGAVSFSFTPISSTSGIRGPEVLIDISVSGRRLSESGVPEAVNSSVSKRVLIESNLALTGRAVRTVGPFNNTGPLPPKAEVETTYTIIWTITNSSNNVSNTSVKATLPSYVRFLNRVSPISEDLTYNETSGIIEWDVGTVPSGTGFDTAPKEVAFQISMIPSLSQVGRIPILINPQTIKGIDRFTDTTISVEKKGIDTRLSTDPNVASGHQQVTQ